MDLAQPDKDALQAVGNWLGGIVNWWGTIDWGSAPDWFAAVGTISAVVFALAQAQRERRERREQAAGDAARIAELEERERVARVQGVLVEFFYESAIEKSAYGDGKPARYRVEIRNQSRLPLYRAVLATADGTFIDYIGALPAGSPDPTICRWAAEEGPSPSQVILMFADVDGYMWNIRSDGRLVGESDPDFRARFVAMTGPQS